MNAEREPEDWQGIYRDVLVQAIDKARGLGARDRFTASLNNSYIGRRWMIEWVEGSRDYRLASPMCQTDGSRERDVRLHGGIASAIDWQLFTRDRNFWTEVVGDGS